jgi:hypothetical protein
MKRWTIHLVVFGLFAVCLIGSGFAADMYDDALKEIRPYVQKDVYDKVEDLAQSISIQAGRAFFDAAIFPTNARYDADGNRTGQLGSLFNEPFWTVGEGEHLSGLYYSRISYEEYDGDDINDVFDKFGQFELVSDDGNGLFTYKQTAVRGGTTLDYDTIWLSHTYGISERVDIAIAIPLMRSDVDAVMHDGLLLQQVVGGPPDETDDFKDFTFSNPARGKTNGEDTGLGDIITRLKWNVFDEMQDDTMLSWTLGIDVKFPTGSEEDMLGNDDLAVRLRTQFAKEYERCIPQLELAVILSGEGDVDGDSYNSFQYKGSLPWMLAEFEDQDTGELDGSLTVSLDLMGNMSELASFHEVGLNARLALGHRISINGGAKIPYSSDNAITTDWTPTIGIEFRW